MKEPKIIFNAVYCPKCDTVAESTHRHDFRYCACGAVAADGGKEYLRRVGDFTTCIDISLYEGEEDELNEYRKLGKSTFLEAQMAKRKRLSDKQKESRSPSPPDREQDLQGTRDN